MSKIRVLVGHGNPVFGLGLSRLLAEEKDIEVVGTATDAEEAVTMAKELKPNVAIVEIAMPKLSGIEVAKQIKAECPSTAILMLSDYKYGTNVIPSLRAGALGYLLESCPLSELISAIHSVHRGEEVFAPRAAADILHRLAAHQKGNSVFEELHPRELEVIRLVTKGMANRSIAEYLKISERTVCSHLANIFRKLGACSRTDAVVSALKRGLITFDDLS